MELKKLFWELWKRLKVAIVWRISYCYERVLYRITYWHRRRLVNTIFVGITGSAGKTTTKDLVAAILQRHFASEGRKTMGTLNSIEYVPALVLGTHKSDAYCVTEIGAPGPGTMDLPLALIRPSVGVVTNVDADHFSAYGSKEAIAVEKSKLVRSLPTEGIAVLNADDPLVKGMAEQVVGRIVTFGLAENAMLRGDSLQSVWPERLSLNVTWQGESLRVQTQLCGTHWASSVLAALATGVSLGVRLADAAAAIADVLPFAGRMDPVVVDGIIFIRDDWKAPLSTIAPAFDFMRNAKASRKIIVMGTISDYRGDSAKRYQEIAQSALEIADCVVFVGDRASAALRAKRSASDELHAFASIRDASAYLSSYLKSGDLVLLKGSAKADHLQRLLLTRTSGVQCWRTDCRLNQFCDTCALLQTPSGPAVTAASPTLALESTAMTDATRRLEAATVVVVGLGNPHQRLADTPHNVGYRTIEILAQRMGQDWLAEGDLAMVALGELHGQKICLIKPFSPMNEIGPALAALANELGFEVHQCILVHDDLDLPLGAVRARNRGSDGGHRGVRSIIQAFQDDRFRRVKIGVGHAPEGQSVIDFVLTPFSEEQRAIVTTINSAAADKVIELLRQRVTV